MLSEYIKRDNFQKLKDGLVDRVHLFKYLPIGRVPYYQFVGRK